MKEDNQMDRIEKKLDILFGLLEDRLTVHISTSSNTTYQPEAKEDKTSEDWREELRELLKDETDMERVMIPEYARGYAELVLGDFIEQEKRKSYEESVLNGAKEKVFEKITVESQVPQKFFDKYVEKMFSEEEILLMLELLRDGYTKSIEWPSGRLYEKLPKLLKEK